MVIRNELDGFRKFDELLKISDLELMGIWGAMGGLIGLTVFGWILGCVGLTWTTKIKDSRQKHEKYGSASEEYRKVPAFKPINIIL